MRFVDRIFGKGKEDSDENIQDDEAPLVFISYSSYDKKIANNVCNFLESHNVKCFILPRDAEQGTEIGNQIKDALKKTELVLLIFSKHSNKSLRVQKQMELAFNQYKTILRFEIDGSDPTGPMEYYLMNNQWVGGHPNPEKHFNKLLKEISKLIDNPHIIEWGEIEETDSKDNENPVQEVSHIEDHTTNESKTVKKPFKAYSGSKPYIFISYAHKDSELVFREIKKFRDKGYPIWYDQGLTAGKEWDEEIEEALLKSSLLVVFITKTSMSRSNVVDEIKLALEERIDIVPIYLEETALAKGLKLRLSQKHAIFKHTSHEEDYLEECFKAFDKAGINKID